MGHQRPRDPREYDVDEKERAELFRMIRPATFGAVGDELPDQEVSPQEGPMMAPGFLNYHAVAKLASNKPALLIDPGSVHNLCGDRWAKEVARQAKKHGRTPSYDRRKKALEVNGVGQGSQHCHYDVNLPIGFRDTRKQQVEVGVRSATVANSDLPGLLGLQALEKTGAVLDLRTGTLSMWCQ